MILLSVAMICISVPVIGVSVMMVSNSLTDPSTRFLGVIGSCGGLAAITLSIISLAIG